MWNNFVTAPKFPLPWPHSQCNCNLYLTLLSPIGDQTPSSDKPQSSIKQVKWKDQHLQLNCGHLKNWHPLVILIKMWGTFYFVLSQVLLWITCLQCLAFWKNPKARLRTQVACGDLRVLWSWGCIPSGHITQITWLLEPEVCLPLNLFLFGEIAVQFGL